MKLIRAAQKFWREEEGQSTTEYILILGVVVLIAVKFKGFITAKIKSATDKVGENIDKGIGETADF